MSIGVPVRSSTLYSTIATPCQPKCSTSRRETLDQVRIGGDAFTINAHAA
jgi:hypothetical protein